MYYEFASRVLSAVGFVNGFVTSGQLMDKFVRGTAGRAWWQLAAFACLGVLVGPVCATLAVLVAVFMPKTKRFTSTATDSDVEMWAMSTAAKSYDRVVIDKNNVISGRTLELIGRCFWLKWVWITECTSMDGRRVRAGARREWIML